MHLSARGAQRTREESAKLSMYSKQWLPGDTLRVFYPIFWEDGQPQIAVGAIWGHSVSDIKSLGLKTSFIPSTTQFDENGTPIGQPDVTYQFSQIAPVFVNGQKRIEEDRIMKKQWPTESARKAALKDLEEKFDSKNNMSAVRPIISSAKYYISTEVVSMKIANDKPITDSIKITSAPLSGKVITQLYTLLDDPKYQPAEGEEFFEVEWKYPMDQKKGESSKAANPNGLTAEYRSPVQFPDAYRIVSGTFPSVCTNAESIVRRATRSIDPAKVRAALTQYAIVQSEYLDAVIDEDVDRLCAHADLIDELGVVRSITNQELIAKIQESIQEMEASRPSVPESIPNPVNASAEVPSDTTAGVEKVMEELEGSIPDTLAGAPNLSDILNNQEALNAGGSMQIADAEVENIDLTSMV